MAKFNPFFKILAIVIPLSVIYLFIQYRGPSVSKETQNVSYLQNVQPILASKCYACHGPDEAKREAGLRLDQPESLIEKLESGKAAVNLDSLSESEIIKRIRSTDPEEVMPPPDFPKKLEPEEIEMITAWVNSGANIEKHWSFRPLTKEEIPEENIPEGWATNPVDAFVATKLNEKNLTFSEEADKVTLMKRLYFDLHGLPPTPEDVDSFIKDDSENAYESLVDKLLASPRYGERWARHWLDIVHYGESHGYDKDKRRPNAWPYRDYVIGALNEDLNYSRFIKDQIAGDILFPTEPRSTEALGFLAAGPWDFVGHVELREGTKDKRIARNLDRDDVLTNTFATFQSLTIQCARCHDHKFDPIKQRDYYNLQSVFAGIDKADRPYYDHPELLVKRNRLRDSLKNINAELDALQSSQKNEKRKIDNLKSAVSQINEEIKEMPEPKYVFAANTLFPANYMFTPANGIRTVNLLNRGDTEQPLEPSFPKGMEILDNLDSDFKLNESKSEGERRAALARWITDENNAFTWRSIVNRVWQYHFGSGLVPTPNDFGKMGTPPSHPELLDYLANEFLENGQSLKWLHKVIVTSNTYKQKVEDNKKNIAIDGSNRFYWRGNRQALDAESVRDGVLQISGKLNLKMGGPSFDVFGFEDDHSPRYLYSSFNHSDSTTFRRTIYRSIIRSVPDPFMSTLDCADPSQSVPVRNESVTALQALTTLNNPFMIRQADYFAERLQSEEKEEKSQIKRGFQLCLLRDPTENELEKALKYIDQFGLAPFCRVLFSMNEFLYID